MKVPGFILRRLYLKGSLRNMPGGFQFQLQNNLGSGQARKLMPLMNLVSTIQVEGISLNKGTHKIGMGFVVAGMGDLVFDFVDEVQEE